MSKIVIDYTESRLREPEDSPLTCAWCGEPLNEKAFEAGYTDYGTDSKGYVYCESCTEMGYNKPEYLYEE